MRTSLALLVYALLLALPSPPQAPAQSRGIRQVSVVTQQGKSVDLYKGSHALLIGVSDYTAGWPDLESIPGELAQLQSVLEGQGFSVTRVMNPDRNGMRQAFEQFISKYGYDYDNRLLFFYSGHGYTRKPGGRLQGYLVPADAPNPELDERGFLRKAITMSQVQVWARDIEAKHALFLFDSCFSGSIFKTRALPVPRHITDKTIKPVRQFITAGSAGEEVPARSVFLPTFIRAIEGAGDVNGDGYVTGSELGQYLHEKVLGYGEGQTPQYGKIKDPSLDEGDFVFPVKRRAAVQPAVAAAAAVIPAVAPRTIDEEEEFWKAIKGSKSPEEYEAYLADFPNGRFARIAKLMLRRYKRTPAAQAPPAPPPKQQAAVRTKPAGLGQDPFTGMEFVRVRGATYEMGCGPWNGAQCEDDEKPVHKLRVPAFWMGKKEVTQSQWRKVMGKNPSKIKLSDNHPVENVSWIDVQVFINKLNGKSGGSYRLPSEAEWEFACRAGGKKRKYGTVSGALSRRLANYGKQSCCGGDDSDGHMKTAPVGIYPPNGLGLHDMTGNLWEWVQDAYQKDAYAIAAKGGTVEDGAGNLRVFRGGAWYSAVRYLRCSDRRYQKASHKDNGLGFRLVKVK
ncbi:MAG: SUMF1/EgtB/PvdO family nonheme iron enzyme [SAR324 cluster bacterium]|nr:SUMF1/EgtB/PvdO family nonheme iron enzyme [SAR324 cluster bacterium]